MRRSKMFLIMVLLLSIILCGCNAEETARIIEDTLNSMEEIQQSIEEFQESQNEANEEEVEEDKLLDENINYPTEIDLTKLYVDEEAFDADCDKAIEIALGLEEKYSGTLNNEKNIIEYFLDKSTCGLNPVLSKLKTYCTMGSSLDVTDNYYTKLNSKLDLVYGEVYDTLSFEYEIFDLTIEERKNIFSSPELESILFVCREYIDDSEHDYENYDESTVIISDLLASQESTKNIYNLLVDSEIENPVIIMPDGTEKELTNELISEINNGDFSHDFYIETERLSSGRYKKNLHSLTALLEKYMNDSFTLAKAYGFDSVLNYSMDQDFVEPEIYTNNIDSVHSMLPDVERYIRLHKQVLGYDEEKLTRAEIYKNSSSFNGQLNFEDAVKTTEKALSIYGEDYVNTLEEIVKSGHVDVFPREKKFSGSYELSTGIKEDLPYVLMNFNGYANDCSVFAHEGGHAMYSYYSEQNENNNELNNSACGFNQEIASTLNELILYKYLRDNAQTDEEKLFYLEGEINLINRSAVTQTLYSEFEKHCYELIENGEGLNGEEISDYWLNLYSEYFGDDFEVINESKYGWCSVPHFYQNYYVYKYATSITYACIIGNRIDNGDEGEIEDYLNMLSLGNSMGPTDLLRTIEIDPLDKGVYVEFANMYKNLVDEYEELLVEMGRIVQ